MRPCPPWARKRKFQKDRCSRDLEVAVATITTSNTQTAQRLKKCSLHCSQLTSKQCADWTRPEFGADSSLGIISSKLQKRTSLWQQTREVRRCPQRPPATRLESECGRGRGRALSFAGWHSVLGGNKCRFRFHRSVNPTSGPNERSSHNLVTVSQHTRSLVKGVCDLTAGSLPLHFALDNIILTHSLAT